MGVPIARLCWWHSPYPRLLIKPLYDIIHFQQQRLTFSTWRRLLSKRAFAGGTDIHFDRRGDHFCLQWSSPNSQKVISAEVAELLPTGGYYLPNHWLGPPVKPVHFDAAKPI